MYNRKNSYEVRIGDRFGSCSIDTASVGGNLISSTFFFRLAQPIEVVERETRQVVIIGPKGQELFTLGSVNLKLRLPLTVPGLEVEVSGQFQIVSDTTLADCLGTYDMVVNPHHLKKSGSEQSLIHEIFEKWTVAKRVAERPRKVDEVEAAEMPLKRLKRGK